MGFGGSAPCAQSHGQQKFITKHPKYYFNDAINDGTFEPKRSIFGANKHEGSFVLGSKAFHNYEDRYFTSCFSDLQLIYSS